jgi:hypothetical protein
METVFMISVYNPIGYGAQAEGTYAVKMRLEVGSAGICQP